MYVTVINIQDPGALALISWSIKTGKGDFFTACAICSFYFKKVDFSFKSLLLSATHLIVFISFSSQLCTGDR